MFEKDSLADLSNAAYITNLVPSLKKGYYFKVLKGTFNYGGGLSVPAYQIDFVPNGYNTNIDGFIRNINIQEGEFVKNNQELFVVKKEA